MTHYPPPREYVTPIQTIVVAFGVSTLTLGFWNGVGTALAWLGSP